MMNHHEHDTRHEHQMDGHAGHGMNQHDHGHMEHAGGFMSMVMMTQDIPPSADGLRMEDADIRLGPDHPAVLPGTAVTLTVDGDTVCRVRLCTESGKDVAAFTRTDGFDEDIAWLLRFTDVLGYRQMHRAAGVVRTSGNSDAAHGRQLVGPWRKMVTANVLMRWRLKGLAGYDGKDAYDRLLLGLDRLANSGGGNKKSSPRTSYDAGRVADSLVGLEIGQALAALASFDMAKAVKQ